MFGSKRIPHDFKRYEKVTYEFYNIHKASLALDLSNILYITCVTPIAIKTFHVIYLKIEVNRFSAREPFLNLNLNVEMCSSNPASLSHNPLAVLFNYVSGIANKPIVSVLPKCFTNLTGLSGSTNKISNLDPLAEPFIPGIIPDNYLLGGVCTSRSARNCSPGGNSNIETERPSTLWVSVRTR